MSNKAVTRLLHLHDHMVKDLDIRYMLAWLIKTPLPAPQGIGVDKLSIKEGSHVSHRGQRPGARASDLGRQDEPNRSRSGSVISRPGAPKRRPRIRLAVTEVKGLPQLGGDPYAAGSDAVRHVPHLAPSSRRHGSSPPGRVHTSSHKSPAQDADRFLASKMRTTHPHESALS